jgi:hypothetical protein
MAHIPVICTGCGIYSEQIKVTDDDLALCPDCLFEYENNEDVIADRTHDECMGLWAEDDF